MIVKCRSPFGQSFLDSFDEFLTESWAPTTYTNVKNKGIPATNILESETGWDVELAAPGVSKENFDIKLDNDKLIINYKEEDSDEDDDGTYTKREFVYSAFTKTFIIPEDVDKKKIKGKYEDGILKLTIPKDKKLIEEKRRTIKIE